MPAHSGRFALAWPAARSARASEESALRPPVLGERSPRKKLRGDQSKAQHALPHERKRAKQNKEMEVTTMAINKVIVIGNLGADPVVRALPSGQNVANFSLATTERFTDRNGAKSRNAPTGIGSSHSDHWPIRASGSSAKAGKFAPKAGSLPASTKPRSGAANATGPKSWRGNSACLVIAPTATRPRRKLPPTSRSS